MKKEDYIEYKEDNMSSPITHSVRYETVEVIDMTGKNTVVDLTKEVIVICD